MSRVRLTVVGDIMESGPGSNPNNLPLIHTDNFSSQANSVFFEKSASNIEWTSGGALKLTIPSGSVGGGNLHIGVGLAPQQYIQDGSVGEQDKKYTELEYAYRVRISGSPGAFPYKMSRTAIFANASWAEAAIAHAWGDPADGPYVQTDPVRGCSGTTLVTTTYNDFGNFHYEGGITGTTDVCDDNQHVIRVYQKLNTPGNADGIQKIWVDGSLEISDTTINWVDSWVGDYAWNVLFLEAYYNDGAPNEITLEFEDLYVRGTGETVVISSGSPVITTTSLPNAQKTISYSQPLVAVSGSTPYTWSLPTGSLPAGLSLSSGGTISGTPTTKETQGFTVRVTDNNSSIDDQSLSITVDAAPSGSTPFHTLDFEDYTSADNFFSTESGASKVDNPSGNTFAITSVTPPSGQSFSKSLRMTLLASNSNSDMGAGVTMYPPSMATAASRNIWLEYYFRTSSNFTTNGPESGSADWKHFFMFPDPPHTSGNRHALHLGVFGNDVQIRISGTLTATEVVSQIFDNNWHRFRYRVKMDATNGEMSWQMDSNTWNVHGPINNDEGSGRYYNDYSIGRTFNKGVSEDMWYEIAQLKMYDADPGW